MLSGRIFLLLVLILFAAPHAVSAKDKQADAQCVAGGVVGQPCKDNTNGYQTTGHCTHINICAADNWPKSPRGCQPGQVVGTDCPYPKSAPITGTGFPAGVIATSTTIAGPGSTDMEALFAAYAGSNNSDTYVPPSIVGSTSIDGIEYFITQADEALRVGEPLTPAPAAPMAGATNIEGLIEPLQAIGHDMASINPYQLVPNGPGSLYGSDMLDHSESARLAHRPSFFGFQAPSSFQNGTSTNQDTSLWGYLIAFLRTALHTVLGATAPSF